MERPDLEHLDTLPAADAVLRIAGVLDALPTCNDPEALEQLARALPTTVAKLEPEVSLALQALATALVPHGPQLPRDLAGLEIHARTSCVILGYRARASGVFTYHPVPGTRLRTGGAFVALGEPTTSSLAAARIVGTYQHPGDPRPCGADSLVCAWVESALQDPQVAARPWRETFVTQLAAFRHVSLEPLRLYSKDPWRGPFLLGVPSHTGGAFVLAVMEAFQRSLAAAR